MALGGVGGGAGIVILLIVLLLGGDQSAVLNQAGDTGYGSGLTQEQQDRAAQFASVVLADTEDVWRQQFRDELGRTYQEPRMVLYTGYVESACGSASSSVGPFYCPADAKVYIDLSFFDQLSRRFGAPGDFAQAYVIAHEVGHHIQRQIGVEPQVRQLQQRRPDLANELSVRMELQADCFAGVWGHSTAQRQILEHGDVEEGLRAAAAIGDDNIQKRTQGYVVPEGFPHGSSEQRVPPFRRGLETGDPDACDTFNAR
jgi:predicted metalloprotease